MKTQCPKCKKIFSNGKFIKSKYNTIIPGAYYRLCPDCRRNLNTNFNQEFLKGKKRLKK